ncbi:MAG: hypothetical protein JJT96_00335 [Opitutales bacterium]|nr:hypothetical protein [Opitutales bacterium]
MRIRFKWKRDKARLPLEPDHWELYEIIHEVHHRQLGTFPNLIQCPGFNDQINWLKLFDQRPEMIGCCDKLLVRNYLAERLGKDLAPKLLHTFSSVDEIKWGELPKTFVIKCNHDSGSTIVVRDRDMAEAPTILQKLKRALETEYGWKNGEWPYRLVPRKIIVEEMMLDATGSLPVDYKMHCCEGKVVRVQVIDRHSPKGEAQIFTDRGGEVVGNRLLHDRRAFSEFARPEGWEELVSIAERLASGWKYVRVDLYLLGETAYFGEMTFFPFYGCYPGEGQKSLGRCIHFDRTTTFPPIYKSPRYLKRLDPASGD